MYDGGDAQAAEGEVLRQGGDGGAGGAELLVGLLGRASGFDVGVDVELWQGLLAAGVGADLAGLDLQIELGEVGAASKTLANEVGHGRVVERGGDDDAVGGGRFRRKRRRRPGS